MSIARIVIGLVLIAGAIYFMSRDTDAMVVWIIGGAAIALGGASIVSAFRKKDRAVSHG